MDFNVTTPTDYTSFKDLRRGSKRKADPSFDLRPLCSALPQLVKKAKVLPCEAPTDEMLILNPFLITQATFDQRCDYDLMLAVVKRNGIYLSFASDELKNDEDLVREAIVTYPPAFYSASASLQASEKLRAFVKEKFPYFTFV